MPKYRVTDPETGQSWYTVSPTPPTSKDLDELFGEKVPPRSAADPEGTQKSVDLRTGIGATALRIAGGIGGAALGEVVGGPPGAVAGGALGSSLGEYAAEKFEGREKVNPLEVGAAGVTGLVAPAATTVPRLAAFGAGSVTLDALARNQELPTVGQMALGSLFAVGIGKGVDRLMARSSLREVLPQDVAKEAHPIMTEGQFNERPRSISLREELADIKHVKDQMELPWKPVPAPEVDLSEVSDVAAARYEPRVKGRFARLTSSATQQDFPGFPARPRSSRPTPPPPPPPEPEPPPPFPYGGVRPSTAATSFLARPARLFDEMQKQTGIPVYDNVFVPIHQSYHNKEELAETIKRVRGLYRGNADIPEIVRRAVDRYTRIAESGADGTLRDLSYSIREFARRFGRGYDMDPETATRWAYHLITTPQVSLLSGIGLPGRVGPTLRVFSHTVQTGYMTLGRWIFPGIRRALTADGMREAARVGALEAEAVPEELAAVASGKGWYDRMVRYGFLGMRYASDKSRAIMYHGQVAAAESAARRAGRNVEKFIDLANLDFGIPQAEAVDIARMYADGHVREAITRSGISRADFSVPTHSRLDRPEAMTSTTLGRTVFGLYNWPSFYGSLIRNTWLPKALGGGGEGSAAKKAVAFTRWVGANYFLYQLAKRLYSPSVNAQGTTTKSADEKARELTYFGPIFYEGGPAIQSAAGAIGATKKFVSGEKVSGKQLWKAVEPAIPFAYGIEDVIQYGIKLKKTVEDR